MGDLTPLALLMLLLVRLVVAELRAFSCFLRVALVLESVLVPVMRLAFCGTPMPSAASVRNKLKRNAITAWKLESKRENNRRALTRGHLGR